MVIMEFVANEENKVRKIWKLWNGNYGMENKV